MSDVVIEQDRLGALLKWELDRNYCREAVTIAKGQNLEMGALVTLDETSGEGKSLTADGVETPFGILLADVDATDKEAKGVVVARSAILAKQYIVFPEGADDAKKNTIIKALAVNGIVVRDNLA